MTSLLRRLRTAIGALALLTAAAALPVAAAPPAGAATRLCDTFGSVRIAGGRYIVQNNNWGDSTQQCLSVTDTGFGISSESHNKPTNGAPASYPSVYAGCHYTNCTTGSGLPLQVSAFGNPQTSVGYRTIGSGEWDAAYDIWFDSSPNPSGQNNGAELMIWGNHRGAPQPAGQKVGTANLAGAAWDVWEGRLINGGIGWNVVSYVRQQGTGSLSVNIKDFTEDSANRGYLNRAWYMTSVQFGFEPWVGGTGLAVDSFSFTANGTGGGGGTGSTLVGQGSGRCLDVQAAGTADGTAVQLYDCNGTGAQVWQRVGSTFVNPNSGKCLDVAGQGTANGTQVRLWTCLDNGAQQWQVNANGTVVNPNSGKCLDAVGQGAANGTRIQIWDCYAGGTQPNQVWSLR
ncbi:MULTISPECIES: RICIN domain-containing protein [Kitasatospora]|uniref:Ricin B lectin domain-containing protein n=1 Tax=Kitasatospora arboriphila TaxID=258052 RepID=A0ABP4DUX3_9ACTN